MKKTEEISGWFNYPNAFKFLADSVPDTASSFLCDYAGYAPQVKEAVHEFFPQNKIKVMDSATWVYKKEP